MGRSVEGESFPIHMLAQCQMLSSFRNSFQPPLDVGIMLILQMWELRPQLVKTLAQDHKAKTFRALPNFSPSGCFLGQTTTAQPLPASGPLLWLFFC